MIYNIMKDVIQFGNILIPPNPWPDSVMDLLVECIDNQAEGNPPAWHMLEIAMKSAIQMFPRSELS